MTSSSRLLAVGALALAAVLAAGCHSSYEQPNTPLPDNFRAVLLDGTPVNPESLRGKPWVINVWMVG